MKKTNFPLKKTFEQDFIDNSWKVLFTFKYEQSTIQEYHEFFAKTTSEQIVELYWMLRKQTPKTLFQRFILFFFKNYITPIERWIDLNLLLQDIIANRFRTYESIYSDVPALESAPTSEKKSLYSANLSIVCQKYCIDPVTLFNNFTLEQYMWLQDGVIFNINENDKEWQMKNQMALIDRIAIKQRAAETRKAFESLQQ